MRIYVAGASSEADMVARYIAELTENSHYVTYDWTIDVLSARAKGKADRDLSGLERAQHAVRDLAAVRMAEFFWLIVPTGWTKGAWVELGTAYATGSYVIVSGDYASCVFTELANQRFETHQEALDWLLFK